VSSRTAGQGALPCSGVGSGAAARLLRALANEHRLVALCALAEGELSVSELNARIPISQSALSQHLAVLRCDALVRTRREAQAIYYSLASPDAARLVRMLHDMYCAPPGNRS
jgi:DNA-binding transcriptional ArsR family regulator